MRIFLFMFAFIACALAATSANAQCFNGGVLRMRAGPGQDHPIVGTIPAGVRVVLGQCVEPDDGRSQYQWCLVQYSGISGWVSSCGLTRNRRPAN